MRRTIGMLLAVLGCTTSLAGSGPVAVAQPPESAAADSQSRPADEAKAEFDRRFADYTATLRQIEQLRTDFQTGDEAARKRINTELVEELSSARQQLDAMVSAAAQYYRQAPNADPQIAQLLISVARHYAVGGELPGSQGIVHGGDNYERALPIIELLIEQGADEKNLPVWGFVAAYATNDLDLAEQYLQQAKQQRLLVDPASIQDSAEQTVMALAVQYSAALEQQHQLWEEEEEIRAAEAEADDLPRVKLSTTKGEIVVELFENEAPETVANFLTLVKDGFYDGLAFHRVLHGFMAQGGDPQGTGSGGPGYAIRCECYEPDFRHHFRGTLSMAHAGRNTGGSQFFLTFVPTAHLDGKHTAFGRVIDGIEALGELQKRAPGEADQPSADRILQAEVLRDRGHDYEFDKLPGR